MKIKMQRMDAKPGREINHVLQRLDLIEGCHNRDHGTYPMH